MISACLHWHLLGFSLKSSDLARSGGSEEGCYPLQFPVSWVCSSGQKATALLPFPTVSRQGLACGNECRCEPSCIPRPHAGRAGQERTALGSSRVLGAGRVSVVWHVGVTGLSFLAASNFEVFRTVPYLGSLFFFIPQINCVMVE